MAKVSVIVPVYNGEQHLRECLDSIVGQTLEDIEIILVDDGSTDGTVEILEEYAKEDNRITILHQQNLYAGVARNAGMKIANGKYLIFWDADDYFQPEALEHMYGIMEEKDAQICVCGVNHISMDTGVLSQKATYLRKNLIPEEQPFSIRENPEYILNFATAHPWNKMYQREFVEKSGIKFQATRNGNDLFFTQNLVCMADRIVTLHEYLINYRVDQSVSLFGSLAKDPTIPIKNWITTRESLISHGVFPEKSFNNKILTTLVYFLRNMNNLDAFREAYRFLKEEALEQLGIVEHELEYYYTPWHSGFVKVLLNGNVDDMMMFFMSENYRQLKEQSAKVNNLGIELNQTKKTVRDLNKEIKSKEKTISNREKRILDLETSWSYRIGKIIMWLPGKIKKIFK